MHAHRAIPKGLDYVNRLPTFNSEEVGGMRGLTSLTEPAQDDSVGAIVDVAVIGARGDGKTQFIVHAIRTLRAYAPLLTGAEHQYNRDVLQVVMNAREPRPEATAPGVIPHYVFRIRPDSLLSQVGTLGRLALYGRVAGLWTYLLLALVNAAAVAGALTWLRHGLDAAVIAATLGLFGAGALAAMIVARRRFVRRGDIEIVFWDVAGEHVYSGSAADYYSFLSALVRMRREHASAERSYAFAPVLICNPVALGTRVEGSSYARLRQIIPLFASLNEPLARALVAINRWSVVQRVCAPDSDREELVAVLARARVGGDAEDTIMEATAADLPARALPVVKRDVLRKHCLDAEDGTDNDVHFSYLRYDAGIQCEFHEQPWKAWSELAVHAASRWRAPTAGNPDVVLDYIYEDGPGSFEGEVRRSFLNWLAALAFHEASYGQARPRQVTDMDSTVMARPEATLVKDTEEHKHRAIPAERAPAAPAPNPWQPRPLSASGMEEFARGSIAREEAVSAAIDASLDPGDREDDDPGAEADDRGEWGRESTQPGIGPAPSSTPSGKKPQAVPQAVIVEAVPEALPEALIEETMPAEEPAAEPARRHATTLRMPGGFGSGGT